MGFRFQKSIRLFKGVKLNLSKSGVGLSVGAKGFRIGAGPRGARVSANVPGTGVSYIKDFKIPGIGHIPGFKDIPGVRDLPIIGRKKKKTDSENTKNSKEKLYSQTITFAALGITKTIEANSDWELNNKVKEELAKLKRKEERLNKQKNAADLKENAKEQTKEIQEKIDIYKKILNHTLYIDDKLDWEKQKDSVSYKEYLEMQEEDSEEKKVSKKEFVEDQKNYNESINLWKKSFETGNKDAVEKYCSVVLSNSIYPEEIEKDYEVDYLENEKTLVISYKMPDPDTVPSDKEYKYSPSKKEITSKKMLKSEFEEFYSNIIFQITLRTIHELFEALYINYVDRIVFNGWIEMIDKSTGKESLTCMISVSTTKTEFESINLSKIDFKACIDNLQESHYSKKFTNLKPVIPILDIEDYDNDVIEVDDDEQQIN